ncbi:putative protein-serine/threonine phosphatase [Lupinus albus]|uniref:protein-serine/threonine phosphatase n=1 Tax=Lupinus albus TaxID=3870 RepID=A0A6A4PYV0_LUPAL|nr:putative protein-serine/threonine phosphatase [Lupinus albus]
MGMGMRMLENNNIVTLSLLLLMLIILIILFIFFFFFFFLFFLFKPCRFFFTYPSSSILKGELERPLVGDHHLHEDDDVIEFHRDYDLEGACYPNEPHFHGLVHKQRLPPLSVHLNHFQQQQQQQQPPSSSLPDTIVLDVLSQNHDDLLGHTLKVLQHGDGQPTPTFHNHTTFHHFPQTDLSHQRSCLTLEVITGPSCGLHCSVQSTNPSRLPLTLGRVSPIDLLIKDSEVSGKHALINWNLDKMKWELVDMGSLNGTLLNSHPINHPDTGSRNWGDPIILANGDVITLGTTSKVMVHITSENHHCIPFGVGMASDPMAMRRGGKKLPMEDVCYYQWPLPGLDQFGIFGICDGHGGDGAAKSASKLFPEIVGSILSDPLKRERVLSLCDASDILRDAFSETEACMNHYYEGCTATVLLVWEDGNQNLFAQCANVGDSACIMSVNGKQIKLTEDHKITDNSERVRIEERGDPLKEGETRLYGINLGRMLGDKFLKQQDSRFSSEPYISQVLHIHQTNSAFAILASDGLWDVIGIKKAIQLVLQMRERYCREREDSAEKIASFLLSEAKTLRTKDNTSVIFLDFDTLNRFSCKVEP